MSSSRRSGGARLSGEVSVHQKAVMKELARSGMTMIVVTHELGFAREVADTVVYMDAGAIVEAGPPAQVLGAAREARTQAFLSAVIS